MHTDITHNTQNEKRMKKIAKYLIKKPLKPK